MKISKNIYRNYGTTTTICILLVASNICLVSTKKELIHTKEKLDQNINKYNMLTENNDQLKTEKEKLLEEIIDLENKNKKLREFIIFDENNVGITSNIKLKELKEILSETTLEKYADTFLAAEEKYKVNSLFLVGVVAQESAWGTSNRAIKDNNLTGMQVYSVSSKGRSFSSPEECILETARLIREEYLNEDGQWHNGTSVKDINKMYCQDAPTVDGDAMDWSKNIIQIAKDIKNEANKDK